MITTIDSIVFRFIWMCERLGMDIAMNMTHMSIRETLDTLREPKS